jgi:hypothetical protein
MLRAVNRHLVTTTPRGICPETPVATIIVAAAIEVTMTDNLTAVIMAEDVANARIDGDYALLVGAEGDASEFDSKDAASMAAFNNPGVDRAYRRAEREYNPAAYDDGTIVARIKPDGTTEWPLEADQ